MTIVDVIHTHISDAPMELSKTIKSIMNSPNITPGDLVAVSWKYIIINLNLLILPIAETILYF
jgi:hypothetical protein